MSEDSGTETKKKLVRINMLGYINACQGDNIIIWTQIWHIKKYFISQWQKGIVTKVYKIVLTEFFHI